MNHAKLNGVYYTPSEITSFCCSHYLKYYHNRNSKKIKILEPSCGNGEFLIDIVKYKELKDIKIIIDLVDIDKSELKLAQKRVLKNRNNKIKSEAINTDFLFFETDNKYDLITGNPPYIGKRHLSKEQIEQAKAIQKENGNSREIKNIWTAFIYKQLSLLKKSGTLCQVLPIELLHVDHTKHLRDLLLAFFDRIEIFTFKEIVFENTLQDVVILFASN
ncbi:MAG: class I SAM-dependent methyltransferase, partial [Bacteroidota bacterium]